MQIHESRLKANIHPLILILQLLAADHPQPLAAPLVLCHWHHTNAPAMVATDTFNGLRISRSLPPLATPASHGVCRHLRPPHLTESAIGATTTSSSPGRRILPPVLTRPAISSQPPHRHMVLHPASHRCPMSPAPPRRPRRPGRRRHGPWIFSSRHRTAPSS
jgi:hypothetical protein